MNNNPLSFSHKDRSSRLDQATNQTFNLIIIGGGITGAGIALDAALRGLSVILIEKNDFASGTSSKSTKLIHGGLRYLKQLEIGLVRETGLERSIAHNNACHLVHPENMLLPIVKKGTFSKFTASLAIGVYDWLAKVPKKDKKKLLSKAKVIKEEPLLNQEILKSGIIYSEYRTDDARLTIEIIKAARRNSAKAFNYLEVSSYLYEDDTVCGVKAFDLIEQKEISVKGDFVVNATGPWVDGLRQKDNAATETNLHLTKGVHIVLDHQRLPLKHSTYFDAFDGRMIFAIPRGKAVYIGTTDTDYKGDKDQLYCTKEDAEYLLKALNNFFEIETVTLNDVCSSWTGLRPLIHETGKPPTELSRKDEIFISDSGLISIAGGKLTGFRKMAERIVDLVYRTNVQKYISSCTKHHKIHHNPFEDYDEFLSFVKNLNKQFEGFGIEANDIQVLVQTYGKDASLILENANLDSSDKIEENYDKLLTSQLNYSIDFESVLHPMDFIDRRTGWLYFNIETAKKYLDKVIDQLATVLNKDNSEVERLKKECLEIIKTNSLEKIKSGEVIS